MAAEDRRRPRNARVVAARRDDTVHAVVATGLLTVAIVSHHFTAMGAVTLIPDPTLGTDVMSIPPTALSFLTAVAAFATGNTWETFLVGMAASVGAGISMGLAEGLSDDGKLTGRGHPMIRGLSAGVMTAVGGLGHTLLPQFDAASSSIWGLMPRTRTSGGRIVSGLGLSAMPCCSQVATSTGLALGSITVSRSPGMARTKAGVAAGCGCILECMTCP